MPAITENIIIKRILLELGNAERVALGPGFPQQIASYLPAETAWCDLSEQENSSGSVDVAVVEAFEVSENGDLCAVSGTHINGLNARRWIVGGSILREDGRPRFVKQCQGQINRTGCVDLIVTEFGVIRVSELGFELREICPGASSDDVRLRIRASLHVADDLSLVQGARS